MSTMYESDACGTTHCGAFWEFHVNLTVPFKLSQTFIAIAYLRLSKLKHQPPTPLQLAAPLAQGVTRHRL